jgi:hypothetical protein
MHLCWSLCKYTYSSIKSLYLIYIFHSFSFACFHSLPFLTLPDILYISRFDSSNSSVNAFDWYSYIPTFIVIIPPLPPCFLLALALSSLHPPHPSLNLRTTLYLLTCPLFPLLELVATTIPIK